jgi:hypothetical protein
MMSCSGSRVRVLALVSLALFLSSLLHTAESSAREPSSARRDALMARTVVVGSRTSSMAVHLETSASLNLKILHGSDGPTPDIRVHGNGRYAGVVLVSNDWDGGLLIEDFLIAGRWGLCSSQGCDPGVRRIQDVRGLARDGDEGILPAGDYTLHLVTDGSPIRVAMRLVGAQEGRSILRPNGPALVDFKAPRSTIAQEAGGAQVVGAGADFVGGSVGFTSSLMYAKADQKLDPFSGGVCQINSPTAPPNQVSYGPQCYAMTLSGLGTGHYLLNRSLKSKSFALMPVSTYHNQGVQPPNIDGKRGLGAWAATPYPLEEFRFMGLYVRVA